MKADFEVLISEALAKAMRQAVEMGFVYPLHMTMESSDGMGTEWLWRDRDGSPKFPPELLREYSHDPDGPVEPLVVTIEVRKYDLATGAKVAEPDGEVRSLGTIANRAESIRKLVKKLGPVEHLRACYEAGPTGYVLYWQLTELGVECEVIAPTLVPVKAGDRVKTDRRDALKLARSYRSGDLTAVWVPDEGSEALRDLVRAREAAKQNQLRARHRLSKFLLRTGQRPAHGMKAWTQPYMVWVQQIRFAQMAQEATKLDHLHEVEHMSERVVRLEQVIVEAIQLASPQIQEVVKGLQALRGIAQISAVTIVAELGDSSSVTVEKGGGDLSRSSSFRC